MLRQLVRRLESEDKGGGKMNPAGYSFEPVELHLADELGLEFADLQFDGYEATQTSAEMQKDQ